MWNNFYVQRVNSTYQDYFEKRYKPLLDKIDSLKEDVIIEEGVGIGSISKYLIKKDVRCLGYDIDPNMVKLSSINNPKGTFVEDNIFNPIKFGKNINSGILRITHGVLEHFTDAEILRIFKRYKEEGTPSIHYVPLDKYKVPSFGDERLLPITHWRYLTDQIFSNVEMKLFNNDYDLWFYLK